MWSVCVACSLTVCGRQRVHADESEYGVMATAVLVNLCGSTACESGSVKGGGLLGDTSDGDSIVTGAFVNKQVGMPFKSYRDGDPLTLDPLDGRISAGASGSSRLDMSHIATLPSVASRENYRIGTISAQLGCSDARNARYLTSFSIVIVSECQLMKLEISPHLTMGRINFHNMTKNQNRKDGGTS